MGVQLNIKDAETVRLARKLADATGRSVTATIRDALEREERERATRVEDDRRWLSALRAQVREAMPEETKAMTLQEIMDSIYDDGLPE